MPKVLFFAETAAQWSVIRPLLPHLREFEIELMVGPSVPLSENAHRFTKHELAPQTGKDRRVPALTRYLGKDVDFTIYKYYRNLFRTKLDYHTDILKRSKIDLVVVGEDGISAEIWLIRAAKKLRVPVVILPYEASGREDFINVLKTKKREDSLVVFDDRQQEFLRRIGASSWMADFEGDAAAIYPLEYIAALTDMGFSFLNPWTTHGGEADILFSEAPAMTAFYHDEGLEKKQILETGSPYDDAMHNVIVTDQDVSRAYDRHTQIRTDKASVLVSLPPNYDMQRGAFSEFSSYDAMRDTIVEELGTSAATVTVLVHPAYFDQVSGGESDGVALYSKNWLLEEIPRHDIFVTSGSSTLRWSAAARKVTVNFDVYKLGLEFFDRIPGLRQFTSHTECFSFVKELANDGAKYSDYISRHVEGTQSWGYLDGGCNDRIVNALKTLA